jgi:hypothetical protein
MPLEDYWFLLVKFERDRRTEECWAFTGWPMEL